MTKAQTQAPTGGTLGTVARNAAFALLGRGLNVLLAPLFAIVAANALGPESFGRLALGLSLVALAQVGAELGMPTLLSREIAIQRPRASLLTSSALLVSTIGSILSIIVVFGIAAGMEDRVAAACSMILVVGVFFMAVGRIAEGIAAGFERFEAQVLPSVCRNIVITVACLPFVIVFPRNLYAFCSLIVAAWGISAIASASVTARWLGVSLKRVRRQDVLQAAKRGLPYAMMPLAAMVFYRNDLWLLSSIRGAGDAGVYQAAYALLDWTNSLPAIAAAVLLPTLASLFARDKAAFSGVLARYMRGIALGAPLLTVAALAICSGLLPRYRVGFDDSYPIGLVLSLAATPSTLNFFAGTCLIVVNRPFAPVLAIALAALMKTAMNTGAVTWYGPQGAAAVAVGMEWALAIAQLAVIWSFAAKIERGRILRTFLGGAFLGTALIGAAWIWLGVGAGIVASSAYLVLISRTEPARESVSTLVNLVRRRASAQSTSRKGDA